MCARDASSNSTEIVRAAIEARAGAYAPYSNYTVGAALRAVDGQLFTGSNVENQSYGLTCCAERVAMFSAVVSGVREFTEIAIATRDGGSPCGACRQVLSEFCGPDFVIHCVAESGESQSVTLGELFPSPFSSDDLG